MRFPISKKTISVFVGLFIALSSLMAQSDEIHIDRSYDNLLWVDFVNKVEGSLYPNWIGGEQVRYYKFYGNILELKAPPMKMGDVEFTSILKWERVT